MNGAYSAAVDWLPVFADGQSRRESPQMAFPPDSNFERTDSSQIVLTADKHSMGLSACLPIQRDGRRRSRPDASPSISASDGRRRFCSAIFAGCLYTTSGQNDSKSKRVTRDRGFYTPVRLAKQSCACGSTLRKYSLFSCRFKCPCPP